MIHAVAPITFQLYCPHTRTWRKMRWRRRQRSERTHHAASVASAPISQALLLAVTVVARTGAGNFPAPNDVGMMAAAAAAVETAGVGSLLSLPAVAVVTAAVVVAVAAAAAAAAAGAARLVVAAAASRFSEHGEPLGTAHSLGPTWKESQTGSSRKSKSSSKVGVSCFRDQT
jgi:hypothetical protein